MKNGVCKVTELSEDRSPDLGRVFPAVKEAKASASLAQNKSFANKTKEFEPFSLLDQLFRDSPLAYVLLDEDGTIHRQNVAASLLLGLEPRVSNRPQSIMDFVRTEHATPLRAAIQLANKGERQQTAVALRHKDVEKWCQVSLTSLRHKDAGRATVLCALSDITSQWNSLQAVASAKRMLDARVAEKTQELELARQEVAKERYFISQVLENSYDGILVFDPMGRVKLANPGLQRILQMDLNDTPEIGDWAKKVLPKRWRSVMANWLGFVNGEFPKELELKLTAKDGNVRRCRVKCNSLPSGDFVANVVDMTELRAAQEDLRNRALTDPLTGLPNRRAFEDNVRHALAAARRHDLSGAVLFFDLDGFKAVNDMEGHAQGDAVLADVGRILQQNCRESDYPARWGGDEFVVYLSGGRTGVQAAQVAERLLESLKRQLRPTPGGRRVGFSGGVAIAPKDGDTLTELLEVADSRMYEAKRSSKGRLKVD